MRERAATALKITAPDLLDLGVIDEIVPEPAGGAHANHEVAAHALQEALIKHSRSCGDTSPTSWCGSAGRSICELGSSVSRRRVF